MTAALIALAIGFLAGIAVCALCTASELAEADAAAGREQLRRVKAEAEVERLVRAYEVRPLREAEA